MPNLAALRAAVLKLFAKNRWGHNMPPSSARVKATLRPRSGPGQVKSGQILKLVVWNKIGVYSIQLFIARSTIPFSSLSIVQNFQK